MKRYTIRKTDDSTSIYCHTCRHESFNKFDVNNHYCGYCKVFHDDAEMASQDYWIKYQVAHEPISIIYPEQIHLFMIELRTLQGRSDVTILSFGFHAWDATVPPAMLVQGRVKADFSLLEVLAGD